MSNMDEVKAAAKFLDKVAADGKYDWLTRDWRSKIDVDELDMSSVQYCILGQIQGNWDYVSDKFHDDYPAEYSKMDGAFSDYDAEWVDYLENYSPDEIKISSEWVLKRYNTGQVVRTVVGAFIDLEGRECVATQIKGEDAFVWLRSEFLEQMEPKPAHDFRKGDILENEAQNVLFVYVSDDKLHRIGAKDGGFPHGHSSLEYYQSEYGKLTKYYRTFSQVFADLI